MKKSKSSEIDVWIKEAGSVHVLWHGLCDYLKRWYHTKHHGHKKDFTPSKRWYRLVDFTKVANYRAAQRILNFTKRNPEVVDVRCDDNTFSGSHIFLVPHCSKKDFMGTTMIFVPQNAREQNVMFLYPCHLDNLIKELQKMQKLEKKRRKK